MFVGHYSAAFAAKAAEPRVPLWLLLIAAQFVDILWAIFVLAGLEHVRLVAGLPSSPLEAQDIFFSHGLLPTVLWSAVGFLVAGRVFKLDKRPALVVGATVASHWVLDLLVHRPDLPLLLRSQRVGLGIWNYPFPAYLLEVLLVAGSVWLCVHHCQVSGRALRAWLAFAAGLLVLQTATSFGPFPTSVTGMVVPALALYCVIPWVGFRAERAGRETPSP